VRAVPIEFDQLSGKWWRYDLDRYGGNPDERYLSLPPTPLIEAQGKRTIIAEISGLEKRTMLGRWHHRSGSARCRESPSGRRRGAARTGGR
jgi:hypothetical protein